MQKVIQDSTWVSPYYPPTNLIITIVLIIVTLLVEGCFIYLYARHKGYKDLGELLIVVVACNFLTGLFGAGLMLILM